MDLDTVLGQIKLILVQIIYLWGEIKLYYSTLSRQELGMQIIALAIIFILVVSIILAFTVFILRVKNHAKAKRLRRLEKLWEKQLISLIMSSAADTEVPVVKRRDQEFYVSYLYRFQERLMGEERERVKVLAKPYLHKVVKGLRHRHPELRAKNVNMLGTFSFADSIGPIKRALKDPSPIVSMTAARTLARPGYPDHCEHILQALGKFDQWSMNFLSSMLAEMGSEVAPSLGATLADQDRSLRVRIACAEALREMGDLQVGDIAGELLTQGQDPELQAALLRVLTSIGVSRHRQIVVEMLRSPHFIVRIHALGALGHIGETSDGEVIIQMFEDESEWVSLHAARALLNLGRMDLLEAIDVEHPRFRIVSQILAEVKAA